MEQRINFACISLIIIYLFSPTQSSQSIAYNIPDPECTGVFNLCTDVDKERLGRQAIRAIHEQMDDDKDGMIEASESRDFIKEELESKTDSVRHKRFQNADLQITLDDLWQQWQNSAVYNWTTDNVVDWLVNYVHLPMYVENFRRNQIDGRMIPRLAANEKQYILSIMQIRDPRHKRRLIIKATDVVLFGPPQHTHNLVKDIILMSALLISIGGCVYAFIRHRKTQENMNVMLKELETLQQAEGDLMAYTGKMKAMESELKDKTKVDRGLLHAWFIEVQRTKEEADKYRKRRDSTADHEKQLRLAVQEIEQLRIALRKAEEHARHQSYEPPYELIDLLKRTYHIEEAAFEIKRKQAENAMIAAKEQMSKISKMQRGFFGAVRIAHTGCMDNVGELINAAKERLGEIQDEYEERERRWNKIAALLDRDDFANIASSSTTNNQLASGISTGSPSIGNGSVGNTSDSLSRLKQTSADSTSLINSSNETTTTTTKSNGIRGSPINPPLPTQLPQADTVSQTDSGFELSNSSSSAAKRRITTPMNAIFNRFSSDRIGGNTSMAYSNSSNGIADSLLSTSIDRSNISESVENFPISSAYMSMSSMPTRQAKSLYDGSGDIQLDGTDSIMGDQQQLDSASQILSGSDDRRSTSSPDKVRKHNLSTKIFKPFQNIRFRKKTSNN